ncbi:MAG TPA: SDR family oxidoreductase [Acidimicrobiales bacterium]|nr:SDR family oxidoreductase [Acidimicrobiales bacterium]
MHTLDNTLEDKVAIVYGAGSIGSAVAKAFAAAGARVAIGPCGRRSRIDICFNLVSHGDVLGTPLIDMDVEDFVRPIDSIVRSTFLTSQATARHMAQRGDGVILIFGGEGEPMPDYWLGGTLDAFHAQETMCRQLACELASKGARVITIVTGGIPETLGADADPSIEQGIVAAT